MLYICLHMESLFLELKMAFKLHRHSSITRNLLKHVEFIFYMTEWTMIEVLEYACVIIDVWLIEELTFDIH